MSGTAADPSARASGLALRLVALLTLANIVFNLHARTLGLGPPVSTFLFDPADRFADFFKVILSYPARAPPRGSALPGVDALIGGYLHRPDYGPLAGGGITHFHLTPLTTLASLLLARAMRLIDPGLVFLLGVAAFAAALAATVRASGAAGRARWLAVGALGYPTLMMLDRGNLFAGAASLAIVAALVLAARRPRAAAALLGLAVAIRPNAVLFLAPLMLTAPSGRRRAAGLRCLAAAGGTSAAALAAAHLLYPAYGVASFLAGLARYHALYVVGNGGLAYGSSLLGAAKLLGVAAGAEQAGPLVALALLGAGAARFRAGGLDRAGFAFVACAAYALGSAVFGDYHLIVFLAPLLLARGAEEDARWLPAACLMLAPKQFLFADGISLQVLLNPLLLLAGAAAALWPRGGPPAPPLEPA